MTTGFYTAQWRYRSNLGVFDEGQIVQLDDVLVAAINRDSPGVLKRGMKEAPQNRMATASEVENRMSVQEPDLVFSTSPSRFATEPEATDAAVELAREHGIDLPSVEGSGKGGKILKKDIEVLLG